MESHTLISRDVVPLHLARQFFSTLVRRPAVELATAVDWVQAATITLSLADCVRSLSAYAEEQGAPIENSQPLLESLFSLEGLRVSLGWSGAELVAFLIDDARTEDTFSPTVDVNEIRDTLIRFFNNTDKLEQTLKAQRIYDGALPSFESCSSLVDFRPVFDTRRERITGGIISASLFLQLRSPQPGASVEQRSFQLDVSDIRRLSDELQQLKSKILALRAIVEERDVPLLNPAKSLSEDGQN
ncbi:MAG TPA: hypothetical protein VK993_05350 [Chthoniobacterales bacterium]|nr:hypothetical protein [Chthoniobacterales bacterium]